MPPHQPEALCYIFGLPSCLFVHSCVCLIVVNALSQECIEEVT